MSHALHSRYNPRLEAEKYINALGVDGGVEYFILIEPGLGYMIPLLGEKYPAARIIALHVEDQGGGAGSNESLPDTGRALSWCPEGGTRAEDFLERCIPDRPSSAIKIIEWRPALIHYGEPYLRLLSAAANFIKRADANFRTLRSFGRRWFRNFIRNLKLPGSFPVYETIKIPIIITGSGPGLEESIPLIAALKQREPVFVLAVSSSVKALIFRGIVPDLVISTDGGPWALLHLYEIFRLPAESAAPAVAAALSAALPSQCGNSPFLAISDGSRWQSLVLRRLNLPHIPLVQRGTVSASAIDLALRLGRGKILIAGMDLSVRDIRTHVRPYGFDRLLTEGASRLDPVYSRSYVRSAGIDGGGSHQIYAAWFASQLRAYPNRLYTLGSNNQVFRGLKEWTENTEREEKSEAPPSASPALSPLRAAKLRLPEERAGLAAAVLKEALSDPRTKGPLREELSALLFPDRHDVTPEELADEIGNLGALYGGVPCCGALPAQREPFHG